jgi:hypothetical protein
MRMINEVLRLRFETGELIVANQVIKIPKTITVTPACFDS